jgi:diaminohydroxyphosphoribosylaminopyrimidine deaminase/5-amino-6-(5-phosphoribosylamino)uracil reductase
MTAAEHYETAMRRALELAARGPVTGGNPQVGCVLINDAGEIVAEGWHRGAGTPHAEVDALSKVSDATGLTAVVTLEPCNHTGRTGPCSIALITAGVKRVVYSVSDPSPTAGGGSERLRAAGVEVLSGVAADATSEFLHAWLTATRLARPYVTVKWAASLDGRAAAADGTSQWITGTASRQRVHEQRAQSDAIVVGTGTVLADDPSLTARGDGGELLPHQPLPVVIGEREIPADAKLRDRPYEQARTRQLDDVLSDLYSRDIRRVFVEGGPTLASAFIAAGLVDEYSIYLAPKLLGGPTLAVGDIGVGTIGDARELHITSIESLGDDIHIAARPKE